MEHLKTPNCKLPLNERLKSIGITYWKLVFLLASIDILGPLATDSHLLSLPIMTTELHTGAAWIQFSILSYALIMAACSLFGGLLSDQYGRRNMTIFGLCVFILGGFGCFFSPNIYFLNFFRCVQAIGGGISSIITSSVARDVFVAKERMKILGILGCIRPIGISIAPMIGGWIASFRGWRMVFFVISVFAICILIFSLYLLPETKNKFFVNYHKIQIINTETDIIGNVAILHDSNYHLPPMQNNNDNLVVVDESSSESVDNEEDNEWSPEIALYKTQTMQSNASSNSTSAVAMNRGFNLLKIGCGDSTLLTVSWIFAFQMVAVFVFLSEFPYVSNDIYHFDEWTSGLMIGVGSFFLIFGSFVSIYFDTDSVKRPNERSHLLLFQLSKKNAKLSLMRFSSIVSLCACILLIIPPIFMHYDAFLTILDVNARVKHLALMNWIFTGNPWYFLVIPFCALTFRYMCLICMFYVSLCLIFYCASQGLFIPPASVVVLEPYPYIAGTISAILQFWRIILPMITLLIITQCLDYYTEQTASFVIHSVVGLCSFLCFVLMFGCISGHDIRLRMSGWQERMGEDEHEHDYGSRSNECVHDAISNSN